MGSTISVETAPEKGYDIVTTRVYLKKTVIIKLKKSSGTLQSMELYNPVGLMILTIHNIHGKELLDMTAYQRGVKIFEADLRLESIVWLLDMPYLAQKDEKEFLEKYHSLIQSWGTSIFSIDDFNRYIGKDKKPSEAPPEYQKTG